MRNIRPIQLLELTIIHAHTFLRTCTDHETMSGHQAHPDHLNCVVIFCIASFLRESRIINVIVSPDLHLWANQAKLLSNWSLVYRFKKDIVAYRPSMYFSLTYNRYSNSVHGRASIHRPSRTLKIRIATLQCLLIARYTEANLALDKFQR
jgi:hypothetical protein